MKKVNRIKKEIQNLNSSELSELRKWFYEYDPDMWDKEIEKDAASGKLDLVAEKSILLSKENETKEL